MNTIYEVKQGKVKCPLCGKTLNTFTVGRNKNGEIRVDGAGRFWCQKDVNEFERLPFKITGKML